MKRFVIFAMIMLGLSASIAFAKPNYSYELPQNQYVSSNYNQSYNTQPQISYNFDQNVYNKLLAKDLAWGRGTGNSQSWSDAYLNATRNSYQGQIGNQTGVPYEVYICQGNFQCLQQFEMQRQQAQVMNNYADAIRNQHVNVDANINSQNYHYGARY